MLMTVTNTSGHILNDFDTYYGYSPTPLVNAVGGQRRDPLPYPFDWVVLQAAGPLVSKQLPIRPRDFTHKAVPWLPLRPGEEWNQMIQAGKVTYLLGAEAAFGDIDEAFFNAV
jgi:hypothetical protein